MQDISAQNSPFAKVKTEEIKLYHGLNKPSMQMSRKFWQKQDIDTSKHAEKHSKTNLNTSSERIWMHKEELSVGVTRWRIIARENYIPKIKFMFFLLRCWTWEFIINAPLEFRLWCSKLNSITLNWQFQFFTEIKSGFPHFECTSSCLEIFLYTLHRKQVIIWEIKMLQILLAHKFP